MSNFISHLALCLSLSASTAIAGDLHAKLMINGSESLVMRPAERAKWEFEFRDSETGMFPHHFHEMHQKPMHLIVVSEDFENFAHVHPTNHMHTAKAFSILVNSNTQDPDNFQLPKVVPNSGKYFAFAEVMPMDYGMLVYPYTIDARTTHVNRFENRGGVKLGSRVTDRDVDLINWYDEQGNPVKEASIAQYEAHLKIEPVEHCGTIIPKLNVNIKYRANLTDEFKPSTNLEPWLDSYGHAIILGRLGSSANEKIIQHLHAAWPIYSGDIAKDEDRGPNLELVAHWHGQSTPDDLYRTWIQFKHNSKIKTLVFDFKWIQPAPQSNVRPAPYSKYSILCM